MVKLIEFQSVCNGRMEDLKDSQYCELLLEPVESVDILVFGMLHHRRFSWCTSLLELDQDIN